MAIAKIVPPDASGIVARQRLQRWLGATQTPPVRWIVGPPGSGKTALVASYLSKARPVTLWYQLDERDADIATFFHYLELAARAAAPQEGESLPSHGPIPPEHRLAFARHYFDNIFARLKSPFVWVLDDYHTLPPTCALHDVLRAGFEQLPESGRVIVLSRTPPPAAMARLRANGTIEVLPPEELRLHEDEILRIAKLHGDPTPSPAALQDLLRRTHGWAAGLVLLLEQSNHEQDNDSRAEHSNLPQEQLFDYFAAHVFERSDATTQQILLSIAFLPKTTGAMARALSGHEEAENLLETLSRSGYFTARHPGLETVYQYHPLFREFLLCRARASLSAERWRELKTTAARILETAGEIEDAVECLRDIEAWDELFRIVLQQAAKLYFQGRFETVAAWIAGFPSAETESYPWLLYWLGACQLPKKDGAGRRSLTRALELFRARGEAEGAFRSWNAIVGSYIGEMGHLQPLDHWIAEFEPLTQQFPEFPSPRSELDTELTYLAALILRQPDHPALAELVVRAYRLLESDLDEFARILVAYALYEYEKFFGDFQAAKRLARILRQPFSQTSPGLVADVFQEAVSSVAAWVENDPELCMRQVYRGVEATESANSVPNVHLLMNGVHGALTMGDLELAECFLNRLEAATSEHNLIHRGQHACLAAEIALRRGDVPRAAEAAEKAFALAQEAGTPLHVAIIHIGLGVVRWKQGDARAALSHLEQAETFAKTMGSRWLEFQSLLYRAAVELGSGETEPGERTLRRAFAIGRSQRYMNFFAWRLPEVLSQLCTRALTANIEVDFVRHFILERKLPPSQEIDSTGLWPWPIRIRTLGAFSVETQAGPLDLSSEGQRRPIELLQILIAYRCQDVREERIREVMWPDTEDEPSHRAFDTTLHRLRKKLGHPEALVLRGGLLSLDPHVVWIDAHAFNELAQQIPLQELSGRTVPEITGRLERILNLYRGSFLPEEDAAWASHTREQLRRQFVRLVTELGRRMEAQRAWETAADAYRHALETEDLSEELYRRLMHCYRESGRSAEATATYHRCRETLAANLGETPSRETEALYRSLKA